MRYSNSDRIRRPFKAEIMGLNPIYRTKYNNGVIFNKKNQKNYEESILGIFIK